MKKIGLFALGLLGVSVICLSSCDKEYEAYGYKKDVVYDYYEYEAQFQNGSNKKFKLYKDITAKVDNNCLICSFEFERYIIDIEHDTLTHFYSFLS